MTDLILLALEESPISALISNTLRSVGYRILIAQDQFNLEKIVNEKKPSLVLLEAHFDQKKCNELIEKILLQSPLLPIIFLAPENSSKLIKEALHAGVCAYLESPLKKGEILALVKSSLQRARRIDDWVNQKMQSSTNSLEKRVSELEILLSIGRDTTSTLELDSILKNVVEAAVMLTNAEEGSLLLLDEESNELYMRAGHNFEDGFVHSFRLPINDTLAGQVIETGEPLILNKKSLHKIQTAYLVQALIYVPLKLNDRIIGVLGIDNRTHPLSFSNHEISLLSLLADSAAVAIEKARLYQASEKERIRFKAILSNMDEALMILNQQGRIQLVNEMMSDALALSPDKLLDQAISEVVSQRDFLRLVESDDENTTGYHEVNLDDGRIFSAQYTNIPDVGAVITMQDISYLKELNRIKDNFVHTVSHDLRSPLTAILGYAELLERVGTINEQQRDFIHRIHSSVRDITALINDLLDLGRIESGLDVRSETTQLDDILQHTLNNIKIHAQNKNQILEIDIAADLPPVRGNPVRLKQMFNNLLSNAIKYTPAGKKVSVKLHREDSQIIFEVKDQGTGIPPEDQRHIFEKFYRASNINETTPGSGLGLAIVKTIVESHNGRIWVESILGKGARFIVVLPSLKTPV